MNGRFYAEAYSVDIERAEKIGAFIDRFNKNGLLNDISVWCKHGKARVYFEMNSQNSLGAFKPAFKFYYDADLNDVIIDTSKNTWGLLPLLRIKKFGNSYFSGSKTRKQIFEFVDLFYELQKELKSA